MTFFKSIFIASLAWTNIACASDALEVRSLAPGVSSPPAEVEELDWLVGYWVGEGLGGVSRENIAPPVAGQMMGAFSQQKPDGSLYFYEFYLFMEVGDTVTLRIKHFSPEFVGWEEKDGFLEFPLVAIEGTTAYFDGLTWSVSDDGKLRSAVKLEHQETSAQFKFDRAMLGEAK